MKTSPRRLGIPCGGHFYGGCEDACAVAPLAFIGSSWRKLVLVRITFLRKRHVEAPRTCGRSCGDRGLFPGFASLPSSKIDRQDSLPHQTTLTTPSDWESCFNRAPNGREGGSPETLTSAKLRKLGHAATALCVSRGFVLVTERQALFPYPERKGAVGLVHVVISDVE